MDSFEYAMGLFSVLTGLALADIAMNAHKLIRHRRTVKWDGRVILAAALVTVTIVKMWFAFWNVRESAALFAFPFYVSLFVELMILFLIAASCLPDDPAPGCDLEAFYDESRSSFWSIFALFELSYLLHGLWFDGMPGPIELLVMVVPLVLYICLGLFRARWLHYAAPAALIVYQIADRWDQTLGEAVI